MRKKERTAGVMGVVRPPGNVITVDHRDILPEFSFLFCICIFICMYACVCAQVCERCECTYKCICVCMYTQMEQSNFFLKQVFPLSPGACRLV